MTHTAEDIVRFIRSTDSAGEYRYSDRGAALLVSMFAGAAVATSDRSRIVRVGDHQPEPLNENISEAAYDRQQDVLAMILGVPS